MSELELAVTGLAETLAAILHRERRSEGVEQLEADLRDAGQILASTIAQIDNCRGTPVVIPATPTHTTPARPVEGIAVGTAPNVR
jgi:hypothetical protein